jgi:hypothetical protein
MRLRGVRFNLRTLMALVLAFGGVFGWLVYRAHVQHDAVLAIKRLGGSVQFHIGKLTSLRSLDLSNTRITDAGMIHLKGLNNLEGLSLDGNQISDAGSAQLKCLTKLKLLSLAGTNVTNAGVNELKKAIPLLNVVP